MTTDQLLIALIGRERRFTPAADALEEFDEHDMLAELSIQELILDFIGVPPDATSGLSQKELAEGECEHGVEYYCRDWASNWFGGDIDSLEKYPTAKDFLAACREEAALQKGQFHCSKCESGDRKGTGFFIPPTSHLEADMREGCV